MTTTARTINRVTDRHGNVLVRVIWDSDWQEYSVYCVADGTNYQTDDRDDAYNQRDYLLGFYFK